MAKKRIIRAREMSIPIRKLEADKQLRFRNIAFADFETILSEEKNHIVISYAIVNQQKKVKSEYIARGENIKDQSVILIKEFIKVCMGKYSIVYMHNGSNFDFTFILNYLSKNTNDFKFECLSKDLTFYHITIIDKKTKSRLELRDSYHLMSMSLKEIGDIFSTVKKIDYKIQTVNLKNYMDLDIIKEVLDYNERDSLVLEEGFFNFRDLIFKNFNVDITYSLTIASLSQKIYFINYYKNKTLHVIEENVDNYIRKSYFGGKTEVFKPYSEHCYSYDCNSLYSHVMKNFSYPTGTPIYVNKEQITEEIINRKGFFHVEVSAPANLKYPFLVYRDSDETLISPLGTWSGIYFSEEINYAKGLGYTFEYLGGYFYPSEEYIFKDFVDDLYDMRLKYKKNTGLNKTCKLLLNSLYGKFGTKFENTKTEIVFIDDPKYDEIVIENKHDVINHRIINDLHVITYYEKNEYLSRDLNIDESLAQLRQLRKKTNPYSQTKSNVAIASAVTSYARIYMDVCMRKIGFKNIYYSDTDSIFSSVPMEDSMVSDTCLGKFKLEGIFEEAIFIAPKMYSYKNKSTNTGKVVFKGFGNKSFSHEDFKKHYLENSPLSSEEENFFLRDFRSLIIKFTSTTKTHAENFKKRTKIFNKKNQWVDTAPLVIEK